MFPTAYFADRMFAPRYFPKVGAAPAPSTGGPHAMTGLSGASGGIHGAIYPGWAERPTLADMVLRVATC